MRYVVLLTITVLLTGNQIFAQIVNEGGCSVSSAASFPTLNELKARVVLTTGNSDVNKFIVYEVDKISDLTNLKPSVRLFEEPRNPNAFAINKKLFKNRVTIMLGTKLVSRSLSFSDVTVDGEVVGQGSNASHISLILMHEFAHLAQFRYETIGPTRDKELQADMLAGWYIAQRIEVAAKDNILHGVRNLYQMGDYNFFDPNHHGTPDQRVEAFWYGYKLYKSGVTEFWDAFEISFDKMGLKEG